MLALWLLACSTSIPAPIDVIDGTTLHYTAVSGLTGGGTKYEPYVYYDNVVPRSGISFGEYFLGQTVSELALGGYSYDHIGGVPVAWPPPPLKLMADPYPNRSLVAVYAHEADHYRFWATVGPNGEIGTGAVSMLFTSPQSQVGFETILGANGAGKVSFFRRDGSVIGSVDITFVDQGGTYYPKSQLFAFAREGGLADIGGITIENTDPGGIGFRGVYFNFPDQGSDKPVLLVLFSLMFFVARTLRNRVADRG